MNILHKIFSHKLKTTPVLSLVWMGKLYSIDDVSAIELATEKLGEVFNNNLFQDMQNLEALFAIDEKTHSIVERITQHFMRNENNDENLNTRTSNATYLYHCQLFLAYYALSKSCMPSQKGTQHIALSRAFRNATQIIIWQHRTHLHEPANLWLMVSSLFKTAEQLSLLNAKIQSYSDQAPVSLSSAYIQLCMLGSVISIKLRPQQIEIVSKLLSTWASKISIDTDYDANRHQFYIDTAANFPARRITNFTATDNHRYWCFEDVNSKIELCMLCIEHGISPEQLPIKEIISEKYAAETLATLVAEWSSSTLHVTA